MQQLFPGEVFANTADFDTNIRHLLPRYDEMLLVITRCLPSTSHRILELGCGTGELSLKILNRCPDAQVIALDYSPRMLQFAQDKITAAGYQQRWTAMEADFGDWANNPEELGSPSPERVSRLVQTGVIGKEFDACVSSLAIHHLKDEMKWKLFQRIRESLTQDGCFWNADPILPESPVLAEVYKVAREEWTSQQGTTLTEIRSKVGTTTTYGHSNQDQLATLDAHLQMLTAAGFETVAVPWKYYGMAVFGGWVRQF